MTHPFAYPSTSTWVADQPRGNPRRTHPSSSLSARPTTNPSVAPPTSRRRRTGTTRDRGRRDVADGRAKAVPVVARRELRRDRARVRTNLPHADAWRVAASLRVLQVDDVRFGRRSEDRSDDARDVIGRTHLDDAADGCGARAVAEVATTATQARPRSQPAAIPAWQRPACADLCRAEPASALSVTCRLDSRLRRVKPFGPGFRYGPKESDQAGALDGRDNRSGDQQECGEDGHRHQL